MRLPTRLGKSCRRRSYSGLLHVASNFLSERTQFLRKRLISDWYGMLVSLAIDWKYSIVATSSLIVIDRRGDVGYGFRRALEKS
jgi:hypothetical protein